MLHIPLSGIKKIEEVAGSSNEYVSLSQGSIKVGGIPQQIKDYIQGLMATDKTDYYGSCWGLKLLREKLSTVLSARYGQNITAGQILPTHGCIGGLTLLYMTLLDAGDEVIIPEPAYPAYTTLAGAARAKPVFVSCVKAASKCSRLGSVEWEFDIEKIKQATTSKTKMIIFSNPCNPLGLVVGKTDLLELVSWCEKHGIYLVIDEAYGDYVFEGEFYSSLEFINKSQWVISAHTFSKNMALSGWRIGYLVVPEKIIAALAGMQDALLNCLNNTAQYAAMFALDYPEVTREFAQKLKLNRDLAMQLLQPLVDQKIFTLGRKPVGGFYLFIKTEHEDSMDLCMSILNQAKVGLIPGRSFGQAGASFLRLCYARETDVLREGINRILGYFL
ncbi:MAG: pyridoxal phosphate-dependent aminotransferase [bacterium]